jgi:hypothetical protein
MSNKTPLGLTPIWLLTLALTLGIFITIFAPIMASPDQVKLSDWFGFAGSVSGAIVALIAAWKAWSAIQDQIQQADRSETRRRRQKHAALRAILPLHLDELSDYCRRSAHALLNLQGQCVGGALPYLTTSILIPEFPNLREETVRSLAEFIEYSDEVDASIFQKTLARLQIHNARVGEIRYFIETKAPTEMILAINLERYIIDAGAVYAGSAAAYDYARHRADNLPPDVTWDNVRGALRNMKIWDEDVPGIFSMIAHLEELKVGP